MSDNPATMTAIEITEFGGPEALKPTTRPVPEPAEGELLIKVAYAGVNRPDCIQRLGRYPMPPGVTDIPGLELSGTVVKSGGGTSRFKEGDEVCALVPGGGYAEYCVAAEANCSPIPKGFSLEQAAAIPETYYTVWTNVFDRGRLQAGETFLVHGGTSGIGTTAIQLARHFGARVFATAGTDEKCRYCEQLGAERAINYKTEDFVEVMREAGRADLILDMAAGPYIPRDIKSLKTEGRLVIIAFLQGPKVSEMDFSQVMVQRLTITGSTLRPRTIEQKAEITRALEEQVWPLFEAGAIAPVMHKTFALSEADQAHALMESSTHIGKIMLRV